MQPVVLSPYSPEFHPIDAARSDNPDDRYALDGSCHRDSAACRPRRSWLAVASNRSASPNGASCGDSFDCLPAAVAQDRTELGETGSRRIALPTYSATWLRQDS